MLCADNILSMIACSLNASNIMRKTISGTLIYACLILNKFCLLKNAAWLWNMKPCSSSWHCDEHPPLFCLMFQECCICLCPYEDGTEVHALPCSHHFHSTCIVKWLKMNATCPLCKYNILKGNEQVWSNNVCVDSGICFRLCFALMLCVESVLWLWNMNILSSIFMGIRSSLCTLLCRWFCSGSHTKLSAL